MSDQTMELETVSYEQVHKERFLPKMTGGSTSVSSATSAGSTRTPDNDVKWWRRGRRASVSSPSDENYLENKSFAETFMIHYRNWTVIPKFDPVTEEKIPRTSALVFGAISVVLFFLR